MAPDILDLDVVVRRLTDDAKARLAADAVAVWLLQGGELHLHASRGFKRSSTARVLAQRPFGRLAEWLTARRPPSITRVPASAPAERAWLADESIRSVLVVPLAVDGTRLGLLAAFRRRRAFAASQLAAARALAAAAAGPVQVALRFADEREHVERAETLLAITQTLASAADLPAALDDVARRTAAVLGAERCEIVLADGSGAPRTTRGADTELVVPIGREYAPIGSLRLVRSEAGDWAPKTVALATAIAGQIALAAANARLVRQMEAHAGELAALHDVAATLTSTLDLPTVLEAVADAARTLIGAQRCAVFELDAAQRLVPRASRGVPIEMLLTLELGHGAVGAAALRRAPFFTPDWAQHEPPGYGDDHVPSGELLREAVRRQGIRAVLAVPVISKDTLVGVVSVAWEDRHVYDDREVRLLVGLARHAAVALDRARVHTAALRRAGELGALLRAARTVMGGLDRDATLQQIVHEAAGIAGTPHVTVLVIDGDARVLRVGAISGRPVPADFAVPLGAMYSGRVAATGAPLFVADTPNDPQNVLAERDREAGIVTYLGLPIRSRDRVVGVLTFNTTEPRLYSPAELEYLGSFADLAGIAFDNARLYDEAQVALADLKAMQERLVRGETLRALGELAGGAAHHLNNLLTIVVGRVQLLLRTVPEERVRRPLTIIEKAAKDGAEVVRRLQQFARTQHVARVTLVRLDDVVRDVLELTRGHWQDGARARGVSIDVAQQLGAGVTVEGDAAALREALTNIVLNAIDAMPRGGRLSVETRVDGARATVVIADTGIGMPESIRLRAHEPFFTTKGVKTTGLGLSVAYGIVRSHGGDLVLDSGEGRGTSVTLTLPCAPRDGDAAQSAMPRDGALRLLLVDDEDEVREALADMLASHGHSVVTAGCAEQAFERLDGEPELDLVLTDLVMPGSTGWDVAAGVKARRPLVAVGLITGWGDTTDVDDARRKAVDFVVAKPVSVEALQQALARVRAR